MQVWEGEGVITYGRKLIGSSNPQKAEPGTIRGDLAIVVERYSITSNKKICIFIKDKV